MSIRVHYFIALSIGVSILTWWRLYDITSSFSSFSNPTYELGTFSDIICLKSYLAAIRHLKNNSDPMPSGLHYRVRSYRQILLRDYHDSSGCSHASAADLIPENETWNSVPFFSASSIHVLPLVKKYLHQTAEVHSRLSNRTKISVLTDKVSSGIGTFIPMIPDVAVQYECVDSSENRSLELLPFNTISKLIPYTSKYIYIISQARETDLTKSSAAGKCKQILNSFYDHVATKFPCSVVVLKVGGDLKLEFSKFALAKITICSSSPSCFWPSLSNRNAAYLPTTLVMGGATPESQPDLGPTIRYLPVPLTLHPNSASISDVLSDLRDEQGHIGSSSTTVVTGYFRVASKYDHGTYDTWLAIFMKMDFKVVIYCDEDARTHLQLLYPQTDRRLYVLRPFPSFATSAWDWKSDELLDPEKTVGHNALLYQIWNEKVFMVADAAELNVFNTKTFAWVDIGCFREIPMLAHFSGFPDNTKFDHSKVTFLQLEPFKIEETKNVDTIDGRFMRVNRIGGGMFAGGKDAILRFRSIFRDMITEAKEKKVFAGKDQSLFAFSVLRNPDHFNTVPGITSGYDRWMILHLMWASAAKSTQTTCLSQSHSPVVINKGQCDVIILVVTTPSKRSKAFRDAIRAGWMSDLTNSPNALNLKYKFVLGREENPKRVALDNLEIDDEIVLHNDILILPFAESSSNSSVKVGVMLKWPSVLNECKYIVKLEEDVHVRADKFNALIRALPDTPVFTWGVGWGMGWESNLRVRRFGTKHAAGNSPMYLLSSSVARDLPYKLVEVGRDLLPSVYSDDLPSTSFSRLVQGSFIGRFIPVMMRRNVTYWHVPHLASDASEFSEVSVVIYNVRNPKDVYDGKDVFGGGIKS